MRTAVVGLVVCALVFFTSGAEAIEPSSFRPGEKEALMKRAAQELAAKKAEAARKQAEVEYRKYLIDEHGRRAAYYFEQAAMYGRISGQARENAAYFQGRIDARRPYTVYVTPTGRNTYLVIPNR